MKNLCADCNSNVEVCEIFGCDIPKQKSFPEYWEWFFEEMVCWDCRYELCRCGYTEV